jgi:hypothetical protein
VQEKTDMKELAPGALRRIQKLSAMVESFFHQKEVNYVPSNDGTTTFHKVSKFGSLTRYAREVVNHHISMDKNDGITKEWLAKCDPRVLRGEQMFWQVRIMAVADSFEAITTRDRPKKRGKSRSVSLNIF